MNRTWLAPLTGIVFLVIVIVGGAIAGEPPDPTDKPVQEVIDYYVDDKGKVMAGAVTEGVGAAFLVFFGGYLFRTLRAAGAEASAVVTFAGTVVIALGAALDGTISFTLAETADDISPDGVQALAALWHNDFLPFAVGMAVFLVGFGVAIVRHGVLPAWVGWIAIVIALTAISPAFFVAGIGAALLVIASSVIFMLRERAAGAPGGGPEAPGAGPGPPTASPA